MLSRSRSQRSGVLWLMGRGRRWGAHLEQVLGAVRWCREGSEPCMGSPGSAPPSPPSLHPHKPPACPDAPFGHKLHGLAPQQLLSARRTEAAPWYSRYLHFYLHLELSVFSQARAVLISTAACRTSNPCFDAKSLKEGKLWGIMCLMDVTEPLEPAGSQSNVAFFFFVSVP